MVCIMREVHHTKKLQFTENRYNSLQHSRDSLDKLIPENTDFSCGTLHIDHQSGDRSLCICTLWKSGNNNTQSIHWLIYGSRTHKHLVRLDKITCEFSNVVDGAPV